MIHFDVQDSLPSEGSSSDATPAAGPDEPLSTVGELVGSTGSTSTQGYS